MGVDADLIAADIYPAIWDEDWALSYLEDWYTSLVALFRTAAADHEPILVWISRPSPVRAARDRSPFGTTPGDNRQPRLDL